MIPPSSSAEILQAMGQSRPIAPKGVSTVLAMHVLCLFGDMIACGTTVADMKPIREYIAVGDVYDGSVWTGKGHSCFFSAGLMQRVCLETGKPREKPLTTKVYTSPSTQSRASCVCVSLFQLSVVGGTGSMT